ncbi:unnamed protein product [Prorocentrum cordatum]|uniref:Reverse transcriptase domain-containing protein n=1 Tax=Prorocentrum cordatum TaxID=2364126 RepID=A0ABN9VCT4_9DINO|nr:unnamed protein product [Polarella glacialis]
MPATQFGAVAQKGTDFASHLVQSLIALAEKNGWSIFVLFIDLVKAFDRVVRESVLGYPDEFQSDSERLDHLRALGLTEAVAQHIFKYLRDQPPLLKAWGVSDHTIALLRGLHCGSWFGVGEASDVVCPKTGGRQGCKVGAILFNSVYSIALKALHAALKDAGITLVLRKAGDVFWGVGQDKPADFADVSGCAFVDDDCIVVVGRNARVLAEAIPKAVRQVVKIFASLNLQINWNPGKTEAMVRFRGQRSQRVFETMVCNSMMMLGAGLGHRWRST